jgi:hypothetical protein
VSAVSLAGEERRPARLRLRVFSFAGRPPRSPMLEWRSVENAAVGGSSLLVHGRNVCLGRRSEGMKRLSGRGAVFEKRATMDSCDVVPLLATCGCIRPSLCSLWDN